MSFDVEWHILNYTISTILPFVTIFIKMRWDDNSSHYASRFTISLAFEFTNEYVIVCITHFHSIRVIFIYLSLRWAWTNTCVDDKLTRFMAYESWKRGKTQQFLNGREDTTIFGWKREKDTDFWMKSEKEFDFPTQQVNGIGKVFFCPPPSLCIFCSCLCLSLFFALRLSQSQILRFSSPPDQIFGIHTAFKFSLQSPNIQMLWFVVDVKWCRFFSRWMWKFNGNGMKQILLLGAKCNV